MTRMTEKELTTTVDFMVKDSVSESGSYNDDNEKWLKYYNAEPFGDEVDGRSKVISTDVRDLVESDMPSLCRIFLGAGDPVEFKPVGVTQEAIQEAKDKQAYVSHIIRTAPNSFRTQHDWLKASEMQNISVLEYGIEDVVKPSVKRYEGITEQELTTIFAEIEGDPSVKDVEIVEKDDESDGLSVLIRITYSKKQFFLLGIPSEDIIISRNAVNKDDADVIGKRFCKRRGELISEGWSKELVESLPSSSSERNKQSGIKSIRFKDQGGESLSDYSYVEWANQEVEGVDVYALVDFDGDGIAERRHIIKAGDVVLENEACDHIPYAMISSMLNPYNIIGTPRAELAMQYQRVNSVLWRQLNDNMYQVNQPRWAYTDAVDVDMLLDHNFGGGVHVEGSSIQGSMQALETPYIGEKALQVIQFLEGKKQSSTGSMLSNQALEADDLHKETATRFKGMEEASKAKIELVARVIAETGYRQLWEGIAWFASHYQDTEREVRVLGREMTVRPDDWKYDHYIAAKVGTGAGDDEKLTQNMMALYQVQLQLQQMQNPMVDNSKLFNTLSEITTALGKDDVGSFFNNPEMPDRIMQAELEALRNMVPQLQAQLQQANPLADAERVKQQGQMEITQLKQKQEAELKILEMQQKQNEDINKLKADFEKQLNEMQFKYNELNQRLTFDYTKLEVENSVDVKGKGKGADDES